MTRLSDPLDEGRYETRRRYSDEEEERWRSDYRASDWDRAARDMRGYAEQGYPGRGEQERHPSRQWHRPGPFAGRGPKGYKRSDERIREDINDRLTHDGAVDARGIEVEVRDARVTLKGSVNSRNEKRIAEDITESVLGVRDVDNELRIAGYEHRPEAYVGGQAQREGEKQPAGTDMKAMMDVYAKLATPGAPHKLLASLAGSWTTKTKAWMQPGQPAAEGTGTCEQKMLLGGRYLQQEYTGTMMESTFTGINILGYDNYAKKYVSAWIDSMSTGIYFFEGVGSEDGRTITQHSSYDDPVRGPMLWRSVTKIVDPNRLEYEMYLTPKGGKEEKMMEMTVIRQQQYEGTEAAMFGDLSTF